MPRLRQKRSGQKNKEIRRKSKMELGREEGRRRKEDRREGGRREGGWTDLGGVTGHEGGLVKACGGRVRWGVVLVEVGR